MTEPVEIQLDAADVLAELVLGTMAREVEMDEDDAKRDYPGDLVRLDCPKCGHLNSASRC